MYLNSNFLEFHLLLEQYESGSEVLLVIVYDLLQIFIEINKMIKLPPIKSIEFFVSSESNFC
jgi:hypothetical protein